MDPLAESPYIETLEEKTSQSKKSIIFIGVLFCICILIGCAHFFYQHRLLYFFQLGCFFVLGCVYTYFMQKKEMEKESFPYSLFLAVALMVFLGVFYFVKDSFQFIDVFSLASVFLLPNIVFEAWRAYQSTFIAKPSWFYSPDIPDEPGLVYLENKPVRIRLVVNDKKTATIKGVAPLPLKTGVALFYLLKKEESLHSRDWKELFIDVNGRPYGWTFYTWKFGFIKTYLKTEEPLFRNNIKSNSQIIAERVG